MITTKRLILRKWQKEDAEPFATINQDPRVLKYLSGPLTQVETEAKMQLFNQQIDKQGFGWFACELAEDKQLIGCVGLSIPNFEAQFMPCVEIGWRLALGSWGKGYATEAAKACLDFGFNEKGLEEIVAFTVRENIKSRKVMERLGMQYDAQGDFQHTDLAKDDPKSWHVLYRITKDLF